ncbi:MAG: hypothetical protein ACTSQS_03310 [Promethearchaeota archaeon]
MRSNIKYLILILFLFNLIIVSIDINYINNIEKCPNSFSDPEFRNKKDKILDNKELGNNKFQKIPSSSQITTWEPNGTLICNAKYWDWRYGYVETSQYPRGICGDGSGGAIIAWENVYGSVKEIYAQRIDANGNILWENNGTVICNALGSQRFSKICSDGLGGAIIAWEDFRNDIDWNIYAQRIDANGNTLWENNGTVICNANRSQGELEICSDGLGGAIIAWRDYRNDVDRDIYAQRIDANGNTLWENNGTVICNANRSQVDLEICSDGLGGAIFAWGDLRNDVDSDIYAQRIDSNGNTLWENNGTVICNANRSQGGLKICSDGLGGAIIAWFDYRNGVDSDIYAQRIDSNGNTLWENNGTVICNAESSQSDIDICPCSYNGAIIAWYDSRLTKVGIYVQKITGTGITLWTDNGTFIIDPDYHHGEPHICSDGSDGTIIVWADGRGVEAGTSRDIYAQRIDANGNLRWNINGEVICNAIGDQPGGIRICSDNAGGAIITWQDYRSGNSDIYAQKIKQLDIDLSSEVIKKAFEKAFKKAFEKAFMKKILILQLDINNLSTFQDKSKVELIMVKIIDLKFNN